MHGSILLSKAEALFCFFVFDGPPDCLIKVLADDNQLFFASRCRHLIGKSQQRILDIPLKYIHRNGIRLAGMGDVTDMNNHCVQKMLLGFASTEFKRIFYIR